MIVTVTMNPAVDKTVDIEDFSYCGLNRITSSIQDAGGKGINVSKTILQLGGQTLATGFLAGDSGMFIEKSLKDLGIETDFIWTKGQTRTNMKVVDNRGHVTEFNEPGPEISAEDLTELVEKLEGLASPQVLFVLAGSIPKGVEKNIYGKIIKKVKAKGARVFLDADGEMFVQALEAKPDFIKPNRHELQQYFNITHQTTEADLVTMGKNLQKKGIHSVAISLGSDGALFIVPQGAIRVAGLKVVAHSTVGAGDAMVAALSYGFDSHLEMEDCIKIGVATSAGAVTTVGTKPPTRELVDQLKQRVRLIHV